MSCPTTTYCWAVDSIGQGLLYGASTTGPGQGPYRLGGFTTPRGGSYWRPGSVIRITTTVTYADGWPIPASQATTLASDCGITVRATGAQKLSRHCMAYDAATGRFHYRWRSGTHATGRVTVIIDFATTPPGTQSETITITHRQTGHQRKRP